MLSYSSDTSQETDTHTDTQRYRDQEMEYLVHRQEIQEAAGRAALPPIDL